MPSSFFRSLRLASRPLESGRRASVEMGSWLRARRTAFPERRASRQKNLQRMALAWTRQILRVGNGGMKGSSRCFPCERILEDIRRRATISLGADSVNFNVGIRRPGNVHRHSPYHRHGSFRLTGLDDERPRRGEVALERYGFVSNIDKESDKERAGPIFAGGRQLERDIIPNELSSFIRLYFSRLFRTPGM